MRNILKRPMFRKGGLSTTTRMGYRAGGMPDYLEQMLASMTPEERQMFLIQMEMMKRGFERNTPAYPDAVSPVDMPDYSREDRAMGGRMNYNEGTDPVADAEELMEIEKMRDPFSDFDMSEETIKETIKEKFQQRSPEELKRDTMAKMGIIDSLIKPKKDRRMANLALRFGAGLADPNLRGSFLQKVAQAGAGAVPGLIKETEAMDASEAGIDALKLKRFMDIYDREELRDYKRSQAEEGIDDQETAFIKNIGFATESLFPGMDFADLTDEEKQRVVSFVNGTLGNDLQKRTEYLNDVYKITEAAPKLSDYEDEFEAYAEAITEYDEKRRKKARSKQIHDGLLASGKIEGLDISTVAIADTADIIKNPKENVLYEIAFDVDLGEYAGARYFYVDRDDATNVKRRIYLDSGFNPII